MVVTAYVLRPNKCNKSKMLKACWDCIAGDRTNSDTPYGIQLSGDTHRAPPWPRPRHEKETMLLLPKQLDSEDVVIVSGSLEENARMFTVGLVTGGSEPDHQNVACQIEVNFPSNGTDRIAIKIIQDGNDEIVNDSNQATDYFPPGGKLDFDVKFKVRNQSNLYVYVGPSYLEKIQLKHYVNDIRFLAVNGDVKVTKMEYEFNQN